MKRILAIVTVILFVFAGCDSGNIVGGRYFGTFHNTTNGMREYGDMSLKFSNMDDNTYMMLNNTLSMTQVAVNKYNGMAEGALLRDLLKTMPAIDSIKVCDSTETITRMVADAEFKGNSMKADMTFTTSTEREVVVEFVGNFE
jgi:hypothetical protein